MTLATKLILIAALVLSIFIPFGYYLLGEKNKGRYKCALAFNVLSYFGTFLVAGIMLFGSVSVHAADAAASGAGLATGLGYIAAALVTGLSCIGGGIAVASAASAALGAISEDSSVLGKSLIFVGLAEGVCLYGLIIHDHQQTVIMKMYLISDNVDTYTGMRLAGVDGVVVHEKQELRDALETAMNDKSIGIVLLTERFGREFPDLIDEIKLKRKLPLLIEIPDRHGTGRKKDFITSYVNEAIGLKL